MYVTVEEARALKCPSCSGLKQIGGEATNCIGDRCIVWIWSDPDDDPPRGYCGLQAEPPRQ